MLLSLLDLVISYLMYGCHSLSFIFNVWFAMYWETIKNKQCLCLLMETLQAQIVSSACVVKVQGKVVWLFIGEEEEYVKKN